MFRAFVREPINHAHQSPLIIYVLLGRWDLSLRAADCLIPPHVIYYTYRTNGLIYNPRSHNEQPQPFPPSSTSVSLTSIKSTASIMNRNKNRMIRRLSRSPTPSCAPESPMTWKTTSFCFLSSGGRNPTIRSTRTDAWNTLKRSISSTAPSPLSKRPRGICSRRFAPSFTSTLPALHNRYSCAGLVTRTHNRKDNHNEDH